MDAQPPQHPPQPQPPPQQSPPQPPPPQQPPSPPQYPPPQYPQGQYPPPPQQPMYAQQTYAQPAADPASNQRILCIVAMVLFGVFIAARGMDWLTIGFKSAGAFSASSSFPSLSGGHWPPLAFPITVYGVLLGVANLAFLFRSRELNQLIPAVVNAVIGIILAALTVYFVREPDKAFGGIGGTTSSLQYKILSGAHLALLVSFALAAVGIIQVLIGLSSEAA